MSDWKHTWIKIHSLPGFELVTVDVMRGDEIWVRTQVDGCGHEGGLLKVIEDYWDAVCDSGETP